MKSTLAVNALLTDQGVRKADLARRMNISAAALSMKLKQKDLTVGALAEILRSLDCKVVIVPSRARLPEGSIELE